MTTDHEMRMEALRLFEENEKQRNRIEALEAALREVAMDQSSWRAQRIARTALDKETNK